VDPRLLKIFFIYFRYIQHTASYEGKEVSISIHSRLPCGCFFEKLGREAAYINLRLTLDSQGKQKEEGMERKIIASLGIMILLSCLLTGTLPAGSASAMRSAEFVSLRPDLADQYKSQGKPSPASMFPKGVNKGRRFAVPEGSPLGVLSVPGTLKALVILVEFSDTSYTYAKSIFDDLIFGTHYNPPGNEVTLPDGTVVHGPTDKTLQNYYDEVSFGTVSMTGSVVGWVKVGHPYEYYCNDTWPNWWGFGYYPQNVQGLVEDAVNAADLLVDFSQFDTRDPYDKDNDGDYFEPDGWVDNLFIVHTGSGAEWTGQTHVIWSHMWDIYMDDYGTLIPPVIVDGVQIMEYSMEPEYGGFPIGSKGIVADPFPPTVGVYAHEFGHVLGLPDEYDYGNESAGTGDWSLMASGSWTWYPALPPPYFYRFMGNSPTHPSAWGMCRLGFVTPVEVPSEGLTGETVPPIEQQPVVYKLDVPFTNGIEYFLAENRQQIGFDQGLAWMGPQAHGLLVWHIDENVLQASYWRPNETECWHMNNANCIKPGINGQTHYGISLEQADGRFELEKGKSLGDAGDPFPGARRSRTFSATSTPNSSSFYFWSGPIPVPGTSGVLVTKIRENGQTITADFGYSVQKKASPAPDARPARFALRQNFGNPFNPDTWIPYEVANEVDVTIRIYGTSGLLVRTLNLGRKPAGFYTTREKAAYWDGRNEAGEEVASGIYFYTMVAGDFSATRKMIVER
jgi:immune inhibitor A